MEEKLNKNGMIKLYNLKDALALAYIEVDLEHAQNVNEYRRKHLKKVRVQVLKKKTF
jgi:hypothetical protein